LYEYCLLPHLAPTAARGIPVRYLLADCTQEIADGTTANETSP